MIASLKCRDLEGDAGAPADAFRKGILFMTEITRRELFPGVWLRAVHTNKFKSSYLSLTLMSPLDPETAAANALVPAVLRRGTAVHPDLESLSAALDELYGGAVEPAVRKKGETQCVGFVASFLDDAYTLGGEKILESAAGLLGELLLKPCTQDGAFRADYTAGERQNLAVTATDVATSSDYDSAHDGWKAADGNKNEPSRWATPDGTYEAWLELTFAEPITVDGAGVYQYNQGTSDRNIITNFNIEYWDGGQWIPALEGQSMGDGGMDREWIQHGCLCGVEAPEYCEKPDYGFSNQRGLHWPVMPPAGRA